MPRQKRSRRKRQTTRIPSLKAARKALEQNAERIGSTVRGTPSGRWQSKRATD